MKRSVRIVIYLLLAGTGATDGQSIGSYGVKAGLSLADQFYRITPIDFTLETDPVVSPAVGVFITFPWRGELSVQLDLFYASKGSRSAVESVTVNHLDNDRIVVNMGESYVSRHHYISLSPMARYSTSVGRLEPYALLGPRLDFLLKYSSGSETPLEWQNGIILGLTGGAGLETEFNGMDVFMEIQYQPDIGRVAGHDPLSIRNHSFLAILGLRVPGSQ